MTPPPPAPPAPPKTPPAEGASDRLTARTFGVRPDVRLGAAYLPGHPSGVNVLRVPEELRRVVDRGGSATAAGRCRRDGVGGVG